MNSCVINFLGAYMFLLLLLLLLFFILLACLRLYLNLLTRSDLSQQIYGRCHPCEVTQNFHRQTKKYILSVQTSILQPSRVKKLYP